MGEVKSSTANLFERRGFFEEAKSDGDSIVWGTTPEKVEESVVEEPVEEKPEYMKILEEYGGLESNVPINSPYWRLRP